MCSCVVLRMCFALRNFAVKHDVFEYVIKYPSRRGLTEECDTQAMAGLDINAPYR